MKVSASLKHLGIPDGPPLNKLSPMQANRSVNGRSLRQIGGRAALLMRLCVSRAQEAPWPLYARTMYLGRATSAIPYTLPMVTGHNVAGARLVTTQARWALSAVTGRTTWPHTLKMRKEVRKRLCGDMGWQDLWDLAQIEAIMLLNRCMNDGPHLAHSKLANDQAGSAPGGWIRGTHALMCRLKIPRNPVPLGSSTKEKQALNKAYRRKVVQPAVEKGKKKARPLPWTWLARHVDWQFSQEGFSTWWQLRTISKVHGHADCPYCKDTTLTKEHAMKKCDKFAELCWTRGIRPEEAFENIEDPGWLCSTLNAASEMAVALGKTKEAKRIEVTAGKEPPEQGDRKKVRLAGAK